MSFELLGLIVCMTIFLSMLLVPFAYSLAVKFGAIDTPNIRSSHTSPKTRMGGLAIAISLLISCMELLPLNTFLIAFTSGLTVIVATGVIDDLIEISPRWKLVGQILAASIFVLVSGMKIDHIGDIVGLGDIQLGDGSFIFTVFCLVGGINAFNLSDGLDGLAGGLSIIAAFFLTYFAWGIRGGELVVIAISLIGATIGFLRFNSYPAKIFMGDSGSMMLGYVIGVLLVSITSSELSVSVAALAMVVALPLFDTLIVMTRRVLQGHSPFGADRTHLHHRLLTLGLSHPAVVIVIYSLMLFFGVLALTLERQPSWLIFLSLLGAGFLIFSAVYLAQKVGINFRDMKVRKLKLPIPTFTSMRISNVLTITRRPIWLAVLIALLVPAWFAPLLVLNGNNFLVLYCVVTLLIIYSWYTAVPDQSLLQGTMYLAIFILLLDYSFSALADSSWLEDYIDTLSAIVFVWVLLKLFFTRQNEIFQLTGFELLLIFIVWFVPFIMSNVLLSSDVVRAIQHTCLLAIPFILAIKIMTYNHVTENRMISFPLLVGLVTIAARALIW